MSMRTDRANHPVLRSPFPAAGTGLEDRELIGGDERLRITNTFAGPYRWVCAIDLERGRSLSRRTGFLVSARHVLTAAHNIYDTRRTRPDTVHLGPARDGRTDPVGHYVASGFAPTSAFLRTSRAGTRSDLAVVTPKKEAGLFTFRVLGDRRLGWSGDADNGAVTSLLPLRPGFLEAKDGVVCGYPGDKCGTQPYNAAQGCSIQDRATTRWSNFGPAHFEAGLTGVLLHAADTHPGESGSSVWIRFRDGTRRLVGVHVAPHRVVDADTGRPLPLRHNRAVHLSADTVALVQSWTR
jgi:V8-like Glu-specific endopeptidase